MTSTPNYAQEGEHELALKVRSVLGAAFQGADVQVSDLIRGLDELKHELDFTRSHTTYGLMRRLRASRLWHGARWLKRRNQGIMTVDVETGSLVVLAGRVAPNGPPVPWDYVEVVSGTVERQPHIGAAFGVALMVRAPARLRIPTGGNQPALEVETSTEGALGQIRANGHHIRFSSVAEACEVRLFVPTSPTSEKFAKPPRTLRPKRDLRDWGAAIAAAKPDVVAVHAPQWLGVAASTRNFFPHRLTVPRDAATDPAWLTSEDIEAYAEAILGLGVRRIIVSGGDRAHLDLIKQLRKRDPSVRCDLLWHASYVQCVEDYTWSLFTMWVDACRAGLVHTFATVKKGMELTLRQLGCRSVFLPNYVPDIPEGPSVVEGEHLRVGLWLSNESFRKLSYSMLSAVTLLPNARLDAANLSPRAFDYANYLGIRFGAYSRTPLTHVDLLTAIRKTHVSMYVTFSECCPMLPLESLSVGVPCLTGPTSHLFEDDELLRARLVVPLPDRADVIAQYVERAAADRKEIVERYRSYAIAYNEQARAAVDAFVREGG